MKESVSCTGKASEPERRIASGPGGAKARPGRVSAPSGCDTAQRRGIPWHRSGTRFTHASAKKASGRAYRPARRAAADRGRPIRGRPRSAPRPRGGTGSAQRLLCRRACMRRSQPGFRTDPPRCARVTLARTRPLASASRQAASLATPRPRRAAAPTSARSGRRARAARRASPPRRRGPSSSTAIRSASTTVDSRCAMTMTLRPRPTAAQAVLDVALGPGVERAGRLVEHQDRRVLQQRARDADPLLLAARQLQPALADHGVVAVRQPGDEVGDPRRPRRRLDPGAVARAGRRRCCSRSCR